MCHFIKCKGYRKICTCTGSLNSSLDILTDYVTSAAFFEKRKKMFEIVVVIIFDWLLQAFVKRLLQICSYQPVQFVCGALVLLGELTKEQKGILRMDHTKEEVCTFCLMSQILVLTVNGKNFETIKIFTSFKSVKFKAEI